jgi:uncharacterized integral membrane protein
MGTRAMSTLALIILVVLALVIVMATANAANRETNKAYDEGKDESYAPIVVINGVLVVGALFGIMFLLERCGF